MLLRVSPATWRTTPKSSPRTPSRSARVSSSCASSISFVSKSLSSCSLRDSSAASVARVSCSKRSCSSRWLRKRASRCLSSRRSARQPPRTRSRSSRRDCTRCASDAAAGADSAGAWAHTWGATSTVSRNRARIEERCLTAADSPRPAPIRLWPPAPAASAGRVPSACGPCEGLLGHRSGSPARAARLPCPGPSFRSRSRRGSGTAEQPGRCEESRTARELSPSVNSPL